MSSSIEPKITNVKRTDRNMKFTISEIDCALINSIRRVILSEIPNAAFAFDPYDKNMTDIEFYKNTSSLHNEFLGHRLSMIPVNLTGEVIDNYNNSNAKDYKYVIQVKNTTSEMLSVTTDDIRIFYDDRDITKKVHSSIFPRDKKCNGAILINRLKPNLYNKDFGEEMDVAMYARIDVAKTHARWCPVSTCTYFNTLDDEAIKKEDKNIDKKDNTAVNQFNCIGKYRLFVKNEYDEPKSFDMEIESECALTPEYLFVKAIDIIIAKIVDIRSKPNKYTVETLDADNNMFMVTIEQETHTIANLIQAYIYKFFNREGTGVDYIGYNVPHPLEERVVFKIKMDPKVFPNIEVLFTDAFSKLEDLLVNLKTLFQKM